MAEISRRKPEKRLVITNEVIPNPKPGSVQIRDEEGEIVTSGIFYDRIYSYLIVYAPFGFVPVKDPEGGEMRLRISLFRDDIQETLIADLDFPTIMALRTCIDKFFASPSGFQEEVQGYA